RSIRVAAEFIEGLLQEAHPGAALRAHLLAVRTKRVPHRAPGLAIPAVDLARLEPVLAERAVEVALERGLGFVFGIARRGLGREYPSRRARERNTREERHLVQVERLRIRLDAEARRARPGPALALARGETLAEVRLAEE